MENSILNDLIIDPGYILILMMVMIVILFVLQIKNSFKIDRFMKKYNRVIFYNKFTLKRQCFSCTGWIVALK